MAQSISHESNPDSSHTNSTFCYGSSTTSNVSSFSELFTSNSLLEVSNSFWLRSAGAIKDIQPYLRGCKWSPDGTCCLCVVNHDGFHIMELPRDLYEGYPARDRMITLLPAVIHVKESGVVYDFCWYPKMNSHYPETCSWISTKSNSPIQMWDAYDGSLRCSYRGFNAVDEMEPAISVTFINEGQRIVGGYKDCLRTFDVERPGRDFLQHKINSPASCFATHSNLLAVGSWNANIKLFSIIDNGTYKSIGNLHAHKGGITHLQFTPDGTKLVSGARKDHSLCVWDVRYHRRPLNILKRSVSTNQRIYFDISACGRYLVSGGTDGIIRVWDDKVTKWTEQFDVTRSNEENATFRVYRDCCNSISIHPSRPILATGSGQFHLMDPAKGLESDYVDSTNCKDGVTVESLSGSSRASEERTLVEKSSDNFTEITKMDATNGVALLKQDVSDISKKDHVMDSIDVFIEKIPDQIIDEVPLCKLKELESSKVPSGNNPDCNKDTTSTTVEETNNAETLVSVPILEADKDHMEDINDEPPSKKIKLNISEIVDENNHANELNTADKACNVISINESVYNNSKEYSASESIPKDYIDVQFPTKLIKVDETEALSIEEPDLIKQEKLHDNIEIAASVISTCDQPMTRMLDTGSQFPANLSENNRSTIKMPSVRHIEKLSNINCIVNSALESDDDYNDINENKMKYSSHAENNLTFWWINDTLESKIT